MIEFDWDIAKATSNQQKHSVSFQEAMSVWNDEFAAMLGDPTHSDDEDRYLMIGYSDKNNLLFVSFSERGGKIRIISARKATKKERENHSENRWKY